MSSPGRAQQNISKQLSSLKNLTAAGRNERAGGSPGGKNQWAAGSPGLDRQENPPGLVAQRARDNFQLDTQNGDPEHTQTKKINYFLSLGGLNTSDERVFDRAYDDTKFRHEAHAIIKRLSPDARGAKNDGDMPWVAQCATQIEVCFKRILKEVLAAGRNSTDREKNIVRDWLTERDNRIQQVENERSGERDEMEKLRAVNHTPYTLNPKL
ncbi:hypothetical protein T484DRAFT_2720573 [Baffinella frigidus]|nr:hypothetical protein T484DRAFT_2720573 [Cryptophyta sp. CCMP2293]